MAETSISGIEFKIVGTTTRARSSVDKLVTSLKGLKSALGSASTAKMSKELDDLDKHAKKSTTTLGKLFKSIGRIGFYRAIRSALKFITDGFREGLQNAYQFSKMVGYELAGTMDNLATKSLTMKNQLGSAFGGLIQTLEPILIQIISLVTKAANALAQLFAIIGGRKTYLKAVDTMTQYGEAVGGVGQAAKEAMRYLAPFDELNVLPAQNEPGGGGGGASTPDYSQMFEVTDVDADSILGSLANMYNSMADWFEAQDWKSLGSSVWQGLENAFSDEGKAKDVVQALFRMIGSVTGAAVGFTWGFISEAVESIMTSFKNSIRDYNGDGKIGITDVLTGIWNFAITPLVWIDENIVKPFWRGFTGALFGEEQEPITVSEFFSWAFKALTDNAIVRWIKNNIITPIKSAFASPFSSDGDDNPGKNLGDSILDGLLQPFKNIGNWIKEHIIDPIKEKLKNFSLTKLLFGGGDDSGTPASGSAESFGYEIEVTGIKDNIPLKDKIINGVKALFGSTDKSKLTATQKTVNTYANFTAVKNALTDAQKTIKTSAAYTWVQNKLSEAQKTIKTNAAYTWVKDKLSEAQKTVKTWAQYAASKMGLTDAQRTINTCSNWAWTKNSLTDPQRTINTCSNWAWTKNSLTDPQRTITTCSAWAWTQNKLSEAQRTINTWANYAATKLGLNESQRTIGTWANYVSALFNLSGDDRTVNTWANYVAALFNLSYDDRCLDTVADIKSIADHREWYDRQLAFEANVTRVNGLDAITYGATGGSFYNNTWHDIPQYASGGRPHGSLFVAGEAGAELVGHIGGRTEVLNRSQLASTMYAAVTRAMSGVRFNINAVNAPSTTADGYDEEAMYRAMLRALNDSDNNDRPIELDGDVVYRKMVQRNKMNTRMTGRNALASA